MTCLAAFLLLAASTPALTPPTGPHPVGRSSLTWTSPQERTLFVQLWYPARKARAAQPAPYLPASSGFSHQSLANLFGPSWPAIESGALQTYALQNAPLAAGGQLPVLLFSPGGGAPTAAYTAQMQEFASRGYIVVTVDHPATTPPPAANPEAAERNLSDVHAADLKFVLDRLPSLPPPFQSRIDLARIGAFGHSRGGRTAARLCQIDTRPKACLNQDGNWSWHPYWRDPGQPALQQPFMMLDHFDPDLPAEVYRKMGTTREEYHQRRSRRQAEARDRLYTTVAGGSYHLTITTPGISHNSFLDIRLLGRQDAGTINAWPQEIQAATSHARILVLITSLTRAFFDHFLSPTPKRSPGPAFPNEKELIVRRYGGATGRRSTASPPAPTPPPVGTQ
ncbi:MAG: hypothetical protein SFV54_18615 [Bryobacteraceae bacterium]|nr:hypothetical protein [Bryobacteraceae bacterium]